MRRIDYDGHAGDARRDPAVQARFRVVRVHDRRAETAKHPDELDKRASIFERRHRSGRVLECEVTNTSPGERVNVGARGGRAEHVEPRLGERLELRAEQQFEADVRCGDVDHQRGPRARQTPTARHGRPEGRRMDPRSHACSSAPARRR